MVIDGPKEGQESVSAVLCSGGLDSAVLLAHQAQTAIVRPIYVSSGLAWETVERRYLARFLASAPLRERWLPCAQLDCDVSDTYPNTHWALRGASPGYLTADEEVYLVGRNVLLLAKAAVYCVTRRIVRIVVGPLAGNPFSDATPQFFVAMAEALSLGLDHSIVIDAPFSTFTKADVIRLAGDLEIPLEHTLSCMSPAGERHCGRCSKCRERLQAFDTAGVIDPADYAFRPSNISTGE